MAYPPSNMITADYPDGKQSFDPSEPATQNPGAFQTQMLLGMLSLSPTLSRYRQALAEMRAGTSDTRVAFIGDSIFAGAFSGLDAWTNARQGSIPVLVGNAMDSLGLPISQDSVFGNGGSNLGTPYNQLVTFTTANWTVNAPGWVGGNCFRNDTNEASMMTLRAGKSFNKATVYYLASPAGASFDIAVDNGVTQGATVSTVGGLAAVAVVRTFALGGRSLNIRRLLGAGPCPILGIILEDTTARRIQIFNWGSGGSTSGAWIDTTAAGYSPFEAIAQIEPDLSIIHLGINNAIAATAPATFISEMATLLTQCLVTGDVIGCMPSPIIVSQATAAVQTGLYRPLRALYQEFGCPIVDFNSLYGTYLNGVASGYFAPANDAAGVHPGANGYGIQANMVLNVPGLISPLQ